MFAYKYSVNVSNNIEDRLERVENVLIHVLRRLESLEELLGSLGLNSDVLRIAYVLVALYSVSITLAFESARRVSMLAHQLKLNPISGKLSRCPLSAEK